MRARDARHGALGGLSGVARTRFAPGASAHAAALLWLAIRRGNATGLGIYRELINREKRSIASWDRQYGPKALLENPDPREMQNLGKMQNSM